MPVEPPRIPPPRWTAPYFASIGKFVFRDIVGINSVSHDFASVPAIHGRHHTSFVI
jgi:hypothetical protein